MRQSVSRWSESVFQSISPEGNQSVSNIITQSIKQTVRQSVNESVSQSGNWSDSQPISQLVNQLKTNRRNSQSVNKSINPLKWYHVDCRTILMIKSRTWHLTIIVGQLVQSRSCLLHEDKLPFASFKIWF